jgi:hypothetical protein
MFFTGYSPLHFDDHHIVNADVSEGKKKIASRNHLESG